VKRRKESLVDRLLDSYAEVGGINHIDGVNLPSKGAVAEMTQVLLHLLFPGFYENGCLTHKSLETVITRQLKTVRTRLVLELEKSLDYRPAQAGGGPTKELAKNLAEEFLARLPFIREKVNSDVEAAYEGDPAATSFEEIILAYPGLEAIAVQRLAHELHKLGVALIPRMMTEWAHARTGIDIHPGAVIGSHFFIDHGTGVVIGETCIIGDHVKIYHGVTLGARSTSGGQTLRGAKRHPTIEDHVTIYPGATILGGETVIGSGTTVGGNVFLLQSVPAQSLVYYEEHSVVIKSKQAADIDSWSI
jgi:serine O-acetyltransferase